MEFNFGFGLLAGLVGAVAMTVMMKAAGAMGMTRMPPMNLIQGAMFTDDEATAKKIGMLTHIGVMGTLVFGTLYAALFAAFGTASWLAGVAIGVVHGVVAGVFMAMMGSTHPRMEPAAAFSGGATFRSEPGRLRIEQPGLFARNYGAMTPVGLVMGHIIYGLVVALVYGAFVA